MRLKSVTVYWSNWSKTEQNALHLEKLPYLHHCQTIAKATDSHPGRTDTHSQAAAATITTKMMPQSDTRHCNKGTTKPTDANPEITMTKAMLPQIQPTDCVLFNFSFY